MELYKLAQDRMDAVLAQVRDDQWDRPSACTEWTVRDVAGHVAWGQGQLGAWATGADFERPQGAPGTPHPGELTGPDPVATWRVARAEADAVLTEETLARTTTITGIGEVPLAGVLPLLITDLTTHSWDIGHALGMDVRLEPELVGAAFEWARANVVRRPGFFDHEVTPPADADEQTRLLAFLGRVAWRPVPA